MFLGTTAHSVDAKGRIVLPAKFREELGETFYIARGFGNQCVQVMSAEQFERITKHIMELPAGQAMTLQYAFTATASEVSPNASGRIMIPQSLREFAGLDGEALVLGMVNRIEIWNKSKYEAFSETHRGDFDGALDSLTF